MKLIKRLLLTPLQSQLQPVNFIDLGKLSSTNGSQTYPFAGSPNFKEYKYVLIQCQQYNHLFASAIIE